MTFCISTIFLVVEVTIRKDLREGFFSLQEEGRLKVICAWCQRELKGDDAQDSLVSHGICPNCADQMIKKISKDEEQVASRLQIAKR